VAARQQLAILRGESTTPPPPTPEAQPVAPPPAPIVTGVDPEDDPLQCPYCGQPTDESDERCRHCRQSLLVPGKWQGGGYLYYVYLLAALATQAAIIEVFMPIMVSTLGADAGAQVLLSLLRLGDGLVNVPLLALVVRALLMIGLLALFLSDRRIAFTLAAVLLPVDVTVNAMAAWYGLLSPTVMVANLGLSSLLWVTAFAALISQSLARARLYTRADGALFDTASLHRRALEQMQQQQWALAAVTLKRAITRAPKQASLYHDLALAQIQLKRFASARRALESGLALRPGDVEMGKLMRTVESSE
jgi:hypothetical protein